MALGHVDASIVIARSDGWVCHFTGWTLIFVLSGDLWEELLAGGALRSTLSLILDASILVISVVHGFRQAISQVKQILRNTDRA